MLINCFKYFSFFEEYLRAILLNNLKFKYKELEKDYFKDLIDKISKNQSKIILNKYDVSKLIDNKAQINYLRNRVCHNKIMLNSKYENESITELLILLKEVLPLDYQKGFRKDINDCAENLGLSDSLQIFIE